MRTIPVVFTLICGALTACLNGATDHGIADRRVSPDSTTYTVRFVLATQSFEGTATVEVLPRDSIRGTVTIHQPGEVSGRFEGRANASGLVGRLQYLTGAGCTGSGEMRGTRSSKWERLEGSLEVVDSCDGPLEGTFEMIRQVGDETGDPAGVAFVPGSAPTDPGTVQGALAGRAADALDRMADYGFSGAVLVSRGSELLLSRAYGYAAAGTGRVNRIETVFPLASVTKQFTAAAVLSLVEDDRLSLSDPLSRFFTDVPQDKSDITVHHLLTHTSGLAESGLPLFDTSAIHTRETIRRGIFETPLGAPAGTRFDYENENYTLLALIIEEITGERFDAHIQGSLFAPLSGAAIAFLPNAEAQGWEMAAGHVGIFTDVREQHDPYAVAQIGASGVVASIFGLRAWMKHLVGGDALSPESLQRMWTPHSDTGFGYGWRILGGGEDELRYTTAGDLSGVQTQVDWYPADSLLVIVLSNTRVEGLAWRDEVAREVAAAVRGEAGRLLPAITVPPRDLDSFVGTYREGLEGIRVWRHGSLLRATAAGQRATDLLSGGARAEPLDLELNGRVDDLIAQIGSSPPPNRLPYLTPAGSERLLHAWSVLTEMHGPVRFHLVLGSVPNGPVRRSTFVAIDFERETVTFRFLWDASNESIVGWATDREWPVERVLYPTEGAEWTAYQPGSPRTRISFVMSRSGEVTGLLLGDEQVVFPRLRR